MLSIKLDLITSTYKDEVMIVLKLSQYVGH